VVAENRARALARRAPSLGFERAAFEFLERLPIELLEQLGGRFIEG
jgi:hypothetical protein